MYVPGIAVLLVFASTNGLLFSDDRGRKRKSPVKTASKTPAAKAKSSSAPRRSTSRPSSEPRRSSSRARESTSEGRRDQPSTSTGITKHPQGPPPRVTAGIRDEDSEDESALLLDFMKKHGQAKAVKHWELKKAEEQGRKADVSNCQYFFQCLFLKKKLKSFLKKNSSCSDY